MRVFFFFIGFIFFIIGCTYFILYLNLLTLGYTFKEFIEFVFLKYPGFMFISGLLLLIITIFIWKEDKR